MHFLHIGEPIGGNNHACLTARINEAQNGTLEYFGKDCQYDHGCSLCMIPRVDRLILRGLKRTSSLDSMYFFQSYIQFPNTTKLNFNGYTASDIVWDFKDQMISLYNRGRLEASIGAKFPFGTLKGKLHSEHENSTTLRSVKLTRVCRK